jgi:hypothetical protein
MPVAKIVMPQPRAWGKRGVGKIGPIDRGWHRRQVSRVSKKTDKVEETAAPYLAKQVAKKDAVAPVTKPSDPGMRYADLAAVRKTNAKLMQVHRKVLQKLAQ